MELFNKIEDFTGENSIITLGMFDGVHRGHVELLRRLKSESVESNLKSVVLTFWPHPRMVFSQDSNIQILTTIEEKIDLIEKIGIDRMIVVPFTREFASKTSVEFLNDLKEFCDLKKLIVGYNHCFGSDKVCDYEKLKEHSVKIGFELDKIEAVLDNHERISSSIVRNHLLEGNVEMARELLGYNYFLKGEVVHGNQIGRDMGFPTANISVNDKFKLIPKEGVYAVKIYYNESEFNGMLNIGYRPTLESDTKKQTIEVNIFELNEILYGKKLKISFVKKIRNEIKFVSLDKLKEQLIRDKESCLEILKK